MGTLLAAVTASVPLFDRNDTARAAALVGVRAATAERDAVRTRLSAEASTLMATAQALADRSSRTRAELLQPSEGVRAAARIAFAEGAVDVLKVIDAVRRRPSRRADAGVRDPIGGSGSPGDRCARPGRRDRS
jgi:hypothetical protein